MYFPNCRDDRIVCKEDKNHSGGAKKKEPAEADSFCYGITQGIQPE